LAAYRNRCCVCSLSERPLLDAAHIVGDRLPEGIASVTNGMAMCPTHHRAFDRDVLLVTVDYKIKVQRERLEDLRGEATKHAILDFDGRTIALPRDKRYQPNPELLGMKLVLACG
jgi:putative restriction endonuclease